MKDYCKLIGLIAVAVAVLLSCNKPEEGVDQTPTVTVLYDAQALGDRSYNDLIYSGVERAAVAHGLKTIHFAPQTTAEGKPCMQEIDAAQILTNPLL